MFELPSPKTSKRNNEPLDGFRTSGRVSIAIYLGHYVRLQLVPIAISVALVVVVFIGIGIGIY